MIYRLGSWSMQFQMLTSLFAIFSYLEWLKAQPGAKVPLFSDSCLDCRPSRTPAPRTTNPLVLKIELKLKTNSVQNTSPPRLSGQGHFWQRVVGKLAKEETQPTNIDHHLPVPQSFIKSILKSRMISDCQEYWEFTDNGSHTFDLIPTVPLNMYHLTSNTASILTGHSPFKSYIHKFGCAGFNRYERKDGEYTNHAYQECALTTHWHIKRPLRNDYKTFSQDHTAKQTQIHPPTPSTHLQLDNVVTTPN